jgi:endonuclease/exonuclease/phosphatase family metal-dependent hydrolase
VRLLLDEMISATIAEKLRERGHDVAALQDADQAHLRGLDDWIVLDQAAEQRRAVVTDNVTDFIRHHRRRVEAGLSHFGLLFLSNDTFPRHRHDMFIAHLVTALDAELRTHSDNDEDHRKGSRKTQSAHGECPSPVSAS